MTERAVFNSNELERLAEEAGGYVVPPWDQKSDPKKEKEFAIIRKYSLKHGIPISKLTDKDYREMGLSK